MKKTWILLWSLVFLTLSTLVAQEDKQAIYSGMDRFHPVYGKYGMVASQEDTATEIGLKVLRDGGNAVDAAVTMGFVLAVTLPRAGNIGGGGFMVIRDAKSDEVITLDYREKAPLAATEDMFLDEKGNVDPRKSRFSHLSSGVPGTVAGLAAALEKYGTISLQEALQPAIELAQQGVVVDYALYRSLQYAHERLARFPTSAKVFLHEDGRAYQVGERLLRKDLAWSLRQIAQKGVKAFYEGEIAQKIAAQMAEHGGLITREDLRLYQPVWRKPVMGNYRGYQVYSMPPPSSGGIHLIQMLNILEHYPLNAWGHNSAQTIHVMAEAMKLAYADRSKFLGDPDFVKIPTGLTSKAYATELRQKIDLNQAIASEKISPGDPWPYESNETTHFSVVDKWGNAVSNTYTLNFSYGSGITVAKTGIVLNNEMDDFSAKPGVPNAYGLIGGKANSIAPEKRMLSSMTPTIVEKDGELFLVTGSPGGSRIITTTLQVILNVIDHRMNIAEATNAPRIHHQWLPEEIRIEKGISADTVAKLEKMGHTVRVKRAMGSVQSVMSENGILLGASDPRRVGALTLGLIFSSKKQQPAEEK